jgi:hypothetical protein
MKAWKLIFNGVLYNARMFCTRGSFLWEETGAPGENPSGRPTIPFHIQPLPITGIELGPYRWEASALPLRYPDTLVLLDLISPLVCAGVYICAILLICISYKIKTITFYCFVCLFIAAWAIVQLSHGCHHYQWQGCKFKLMLSTLSS